MDFISFTDHQAPSKESTPSSSSELYALVQAAIETGLIVVGLMFIALLLPRIIVGDARERYLNLLLLLFAHKISHTWHSLIGPLFSTPLLLIGEKLGHPVEWTAFYNFTSFSLCLLLSYFLLRKHVDRSLLRKFFLVLIYGSMFAAHLALYMGEVFTALCVGFGVLIAPRRSTSIGGWVAVILGVANTPATLVGLGLLVLKRMIDSKRLRYILVFVFATLCIVTENWIRHGSFVNTAYASTPGFSNPFFLGLLSILLSFGDGLLFFAPGLLLPIRKTLSKWPQDQQINLYQIYILWICFVVGMILVYSCWFDWSGAQFWGPRFFLFASIPASFALAVRLMRYKEASLGMNLLTFVVFCLSAWVSVDGAVFQWFTYPSLCTVHNHAWIAYCWYTPRYSPLWLPFFSHFQISPAQKLFLVFSLLVAAYMVTPLFIHLLKQIWDLAKKYSRVSLNLRQWHI
jgi:hypothetical protein